MSLCSTSSLNEPPREPESPAYLTGPEIKPADLKIILLGDSAVGKSKLVERFLLNAYVQQHTSTYALTLYRHKVPHPDPERQKAGETLGIDFWDTAGQERFQSMHPSYYHGAHACLLIFDITRKVTYKHLPTWHSQLMQHRPNIPVILVANKIDLDPKQARTRFAFAESPGIVSTNFVSASDGTNVVKAFREAVELAYAYKEAGAKGKGDFMEEVLQLLDDDRLFGFDHTDEEDEKSKSAARALGDSAISTMTQSGNVREVKAI